MDIFVLFMGEIELKQFKDILNTLTRTQIKYLKEIVHNILQGTLPLSEDDKNILKKRRHFLRTFVARGASRSKLVREFRVLHRIVHLAKKHLT